MNYADGVCFAEGDEIVVDLVNRIESNADYLNVPNMAFRINGKDVINNVIPQTRNLDTLPYPDYDMNNHFILNKGLFQMTIDLFKRHATLYPFRRPTYYILTSRGCPYKCTFCYNIRFISMYGHVPMRFRSVNNFLTEMKYTLEQLDFFDRVMFGDDDFMVRPVDSLEEFSKEYKNKIGHPFAITFNAQTYRKDKMEILLDTGAKLVQIGVQSGSLHTLEELYQRKGNLAKIKEVVYEIASYHNKYGILILLDFIIDNPYETEADIIQTYYYILNLAYMPVRINIFTLAFFPGTPLYDKALKDNLIKPFNEETFRSYVRSRIIYQKNYSTFLIILLRFLVVRNKLKYIPRIFMYLLGCNAARAIVCLFPKRFWILLARVFQK